MLRQRIEYVHGLMCPTVRARRKDELDAKDELNEREQVELKILQEQKAA